MISGHGPNNANLMIVSDFATKDENNSGRAIQGYVAKEVGNYLHNQDANLITNLDECYRTSYIKTFVKGAEQRAKRLAEQTIQAALDEADWAGILKNEIKSVNPNVILALGEHALRGITGNKSISKYRGSILPVRKDWDDLPPKVKVVPTFHPRDILKQRKSRVYVRLDYEKALRYKNNVEPFNENMKVWVCRHLNQLQDFWTRFQKAQPPYYTCDIETFYGIITYIGFSFDGYEGVSIPLWDKGIPELERVMMFRLIDHILSSKYNLVNQNVKFDVFNLETWGWNPSKPVGDTMLAGHTLYPELPKNLGFYTSIYTDFPYHKDEGKDFNPLSNPDGLGIYNAKDCVVTWIIYREMLKELKEEKIYEFYEKTVMPLFHVYRKIDKRGLCVDDEQRLKLLHKYRSVQQYHQNILDQVYGEDVNVNSPKQMGEFVYKFLGCPPHKHFTPSGYEVFSTREEVLEEIYVQELGGDADREFLLREIIGLRKLNGYVSFLEDLAVCPDGKLRTTYRLEGTETGRTSGSESLMNDIIQYEKVMKRGVKLVTEMKKYGHSFQTLGKHGTNVLETTEGILGDDLLSMFVPSPGYAFVEGDGSQAEARVVAVLSEDYETLDLMNRKDFKRNPQGLKDDLHTITATWTTGKRFEEITVFDREDKGKRPRHAGNYDQTAIGLAKVIHLPISECQRILSLFHNNAPKIRKIFHRSIIDYVRNHGYLITPYGRKRDFFDDYSDKVFRVAFAQIPQSTVSDHYKLTILPLEEQFTEDEARIVVEKHDSLMAEVRLDKVEEWAAAFKKHSERGIDFSHCSLPRKFELVIPSEITWSKDRWSGHMEDLKI